MKRVGGGYEGTILEEDREEIRRRPEEKYKEMRRRRGRDEEMRGRQRSYEEFGISNTQTYRKT